MAKNTTPVTEDTEQAFFQQLAINAGGPELVRRHIIACMEQDEPAGVFGRAGIGKTDLVRQIADELDMDLVVLYLQHKDKEDISGFPFPDPDDSRHVIMRMMKSIPCELSKRKGTILFMDEFNRADISVINACFTMMNKPRVIGDRVLPPDARIVLAANPPDAQYRVTDVLVDVALRRRANWVYMLANHASWVRYATTVAKMHPDVIGYIRRNKQWLYDVEGHNSGRVCANPASWEKVSRAVQHLERKAAGNLRDVEVELRSVIAGLIGMPRMQDFMGELLATDGIQIPSPEDICVSDFGPGNDAWEKISKIAANRKTGTSGKIGDISTSLYLHIAAEQPSPAVAAPAVAKFSSLLAGDNQAKFFDGLRDEVKKMDSSGRYLDAFTQMLGKQPEYLEVRKRMAQKATAITNKIAAKV